MYHKTNNNNMTRQTEDEIEYGHFYDVEKDEYLDKYKHLKKIIIKQVFWTIVLQFSAYHTRTFVHLSQYIIGCSGSYFD